ncbi:hypothetical protein Tco_0648017 [Tanacetum coccineum]
MRTRSQTRNRNHQQQAQPAVVEPFHLEEPFVNPPLVLMADNRTMAQLLQAPTEGYEDAIVIPDINANLELKHVARKRTGEKLDDGSVKRQKIEDDAEKEALRAYLDIIS